MLTWDGRPHTPEFPAGEDDYTRRARILGLPWCDACKKPAVGALDGTAKHSTADYPYGAPTDLYNHQASIEEWLNQPPVRDTA